MSLLRLLALFVYEEQNTCWIKESPLRHSDLGPVFCRIQALRFLFIILSLTIFSSSDYFFGHFCLSVFFSVVSLQIYCNFRRFFFKLICLPFFFLCYVYLLCYCTLCNKGLIVGLCLLCSGPSVWTISFKKNLVENERHFSMLRLKKFNFLV